MASEKIDRNTLNDWIINDGIEHLFEEGYLSPEVIDPSDVLLHQRVTHAHTLWQAYSRVAREIERMVESSDATD